MHTTIVLKEKDKVSSTPLPALHNYPTKFFVKFVKM